MSDSNKPEAQSPGRAQTHAEWLIEWIDSVRAKYPLPKEHDKVLEKILTQIRTQPETVVALEVGRLFHFFERNGLVTEKTPLADKAIQGLIESGRTGPIDKLTGDLRDWFRKKYLWATTTISMEISTIQGEAADEVMGRYFKQDPGSKTRK